MEEEEKEKRNLVLPEPPHHRMEIKPRYHTLEVGESLFRLASPEWAQSLFNPSGPANRFDHHPKGPRKSHSGYGTCYLARTLASCIAEICLAEYPTDYEVNGVLKADRVFVRTELTRKLTLLDLTGDGPLLAGTFQGLLDEYQSRAITQAWARRFFHNPYLEYERIDGIQWPSAKNGDTVYILYERAADGIKIMTVDSLSKRPLMIDALRICSSYRIVFDL